MSRQRPSRATDDYSETEAEAEAEAEVVECPKLYLDRFVETADFCLG
jgi:hypothetical protein